MNEDNYLYSQPVLDFVTVSTEYCKYLEQCEGKELDDLLRVMRGLLPMIYLKATLLGDVPDAAGWNEKKLTEADYDFVRGAVAQIMGEKMIFSTCLLRISDIRSTPCCVRSAKIWLMCISSCANLLRLSAKAMRSPCKWPCMM